MRRGGEFMASSCSMSFKTVISLSIKRGSESKRGLLLAGSLAVIAANAWESEREGGREGGREEKNTNSAQDLYPYHDKNNYYYFMKQFLSNCTTA